MPEEPHTFSKIAEELVGDLRGLSTGPQPRYNIGGRAARPKERVTQPLGAVVEQLLQQYQIGRSSPEQTIREHWAAIVDPRGGKANATYSHPLRIERNQLIVLTSHAVVRNELFMHKDDIVARIRKLPGCGDVKFLHLRSG